MREILFRGKRVDNGEWETGGIVTINGGTSYEHVYIADKMTGYLTFVIPETVGEFTGLNDKNGKKIFEGDICQVNSLTRKGKVKKSFEICYGSYHDENSFESEIFLGFFGKGKLENEVMRFSLLEEGLVENCEVIGNIHDNPELLEVEE